MALDPHSMLSLTREAVLAPGGALMALPAQENTVEIRHAHTGQVHATYYGLQEGMHHLVTDHVKEITWVSETLCQASSSSGATHRFDAPTGRHLSTIIPSARASREAGWQ